MTPLRPYQPKTGSIKVGRLLFFAIFFSAVVLGFTWARVEGEVIHIGLSTPGLYEIPTEIAKRKGFYKEEGLEIRKVVMRTGLHLASLLSGELDYSTVSGILIRSAVRGAPVKMVMGFFDKPLHMLVGRPGIQRMTDLKGKKVAVSSFGSTPHVLLREAMRKEGMNPDKDITILSVGGSSDRLAALRSGFVDATPLDLAYIDRMEKLGFTNILYLGDVVDLPLGGFVTTRDKIEKNPDQIRRVIRATLKGIRLYKDNRKETLDILRSYLHIDNESADKVYQFALRSLNEDGGIATTSLNNEIRLAREFLKVQEEIPYSQVVELKFVKEVQSKPYEIR
jgi:NitT/TauT family transport system substrate-binding protein